MKFLFLILTVFSLPQFAKAQSAYVRISNIKTGFCLGVDSKTSGAPAKQLKCDGSNNQIFLAVVHSDGSHIFKNKASGLCLTIKGAASVENTVIQQEACQHTLQQNFTPSFAAAGRYTFISQLDGSCITVKSTTVGTSASRNNCTSSVGQTFNLSLISGSLPLSLLVKTETPIVPSSGPSLPKIQKGVHLGGAESGNLTTQNTYGYTYMYPKTTYLDYFKSKGFTTIRLSFKSGRLQPTRGGALDKTELSRMNTFVQAARARGMWVILDPHDYGSMADSKKVSQLIGTSAMPAAQFADFWARVAVAFKNQPNVIFGLMNEPHKQTATQWQPAAILAFSAIRQQGANQLILIPGTKWTGAHSWSSAGNAKTWQGFRGKNYAFEVHQYLDTYSSGTLTTCKNLAGSTRLTAFTAWAKKYGHRAFLGEVGWDDNSMCMNEGKDILSAVRDNPNVFIGFTYFGAAWYNGFMTLNPIDFGKPTQADRPQLRLIETLF